MSSIFAPQYRLARWFAGIGFLSLVGSFLVSVMAAAPADVQVAAPLVSLTPEKAASRRAVAVAFVDVEGGVRMLYPTRPGRVVLLPFADGSSNIKRGDILLQIDDTLARHELSEAKLALEAAEIRLSSASTLAKRHGKQIEAIQEAVKVQQAEVKEAQAGLSKAQTYLREKLGGSSEDVAILEAKVEKAKAGVRAKEREMDALAVLDPQDAVKQAEKDVKAKMALVDKASYGVEECVIKAPTDGTLLRTLVNVGETLGSNPRGPALWYVPNVPRIVRAEVEQEFASQMKIGQTVIIRDDATNKGDWKGKIIRVSDWYTHRRSVLLEPMQFNDVRTLEVILSIEQAPNTQPLRIGQRVLVTLDVD